MKTYGKTSLSDLNIGQSVQNSHNNSEQATDVIGVNSLVPRRYSKIILTYLIKANLESDIETATYYGRGAKAVYDATMRTTVDGTINNKYFYIYSANDETKYYVWYNLDGTGVDPDPDLGTTTPIMVDVKSFYNQSDLARVTALTIASNVDFDADYDEDSVFIYNDGYGQNTAPEAGDVGHLGYRQLQEGKDHVIVGRLQLSYNANSELENVENLM